MDWIGTWTGRKFFPLNPKAEDVCVNDIARALSNECRYGNHCEFYSVAEHSVLLSRHLEKLVNPGRMPILALLHDAAEAYLGDTPSPIKKPEIKDLENKISYVIFDALDIDQPNSDELAVIKDADLRIRLDECAAIAPQIIPDGVSRVTPLGVRIFRWRPYRAEEEFLNRFKELICYKTNSENS